MPITFPPEPNDGPKLLKKALERFRFPATVRAMKPFPVYDLSVKDLEKGQGFELKTHIAWMYLLIDGETVTHTLEIYPAENGKYRFGAITTAFAAETMETLGVLQGVGELKNPASNYSLAGVRAPTLGIAAIWLQDKTPAKTDLFMIIPPAPTPIPTLVPLSLKEIEQLAMTAALDFLKHDNTIKIKKQ